MYRSSVLQRAPDEEEDCLRRDKMSTQHPPPYTTRSPTQAHYNSYSPTHGSHQRPNYSNQYHPQAPTPAALPLPPVINDSPRLGPPSSPTTHKLPPMNGSAYGPRELGASTYYDPTSDHSDRNISWNRSNQPPTQSPISVCQNTRLMLLM